MNANADITVRMERRPCVVATRLITLDGGTRPKYKRGFALPFPSSTGMVIELEDGHVTTVPPRFVRFLDSGELFAEMSWPDDLEKFFNERKS